MENERCENCAHWDQLIIYQEYGICMANRVPGDENFKCRHKDNPCPKHDFKEKREEAEG